MKEKLRLAAYASAVVLALHFCILPLVRGLLFALLPFFSALAVSAAVLPLARRLGKRLSVRVEIVSVALTLLVLLSLAAGAFFLLRVLFLELGELLDYLSGEASPIPELMARLRAWLSEHGLGELLGESGTGALLSSLGALLSWLGGVVGGAVGRLPSLFFFLFTASVAAVYLVLWLPSAGTLLPRGALPWLSRARAALWRGLLVYARAYGVLFCVTALLSLLGLSLLRVPYPLLLALLLAFVDLLPILGVGVVLIPWALASFLMGRGAFGLCLVLLWLAVTVVRRILEDRLIGRGLGVHPLLVLLSVCLGLRVFGGVGIFLGPAAAAVLSAALRQRSAAREEM